MLTPRRAAVWGSPVEHSLSPVLHSSAYAALGLPWKYEARRVGGAGDPSLAELLPTLGPEWVGLSLTMPNKEAALAVADEAAPGARLVGAANTLVRRDGGWFADSTDAYGMAAALAEADAPTGVPALVLGSGATARSVLVALARHGVTAVTMVVRKEVRPETAAVADALGLALTSVPLGRVPALAAAHPVLVSTLPTGTGLPWPVDDPGPRPGSVAVDVAYGGWPTCYARWAERPGVRVVSGLPMLLHQAGEQVRLMTGRPAPVEAMRAALSAAAGLTV